MKYKYVILDFGKVLAGPTTGDWFITPKFEEVIDMGLIDRDSLNEEFNKFNDIIGRKMMTQEEEYNSFFELYSLVLQEVNYPKYSDDIVHEIAYNFTYESDKYTFYDDIKEPMFFTLHPSLSLFFGGFFVFFFFLSFLLYVDLPG